MVEYGGRGGHISGRGRGGGGSGGRGGSSSGGGGGSGRRPCHFFNSPGGCKKGKECSFAHVRVSAAPQGSSGVQPQSPQQHRANGSAPSPAASAQVSTRYVAPSPTAAPVFASKFQFHRIGAGGSGADDVVDLASLTLAVYHSSTIDGLISARFAKDPKENAEQRQDFLFQLAQVHDACGVRRLREILASLNPESTVEKYGSTLLSIVTFLASDTVLGTLTTELRNKLYSLVEHFQDTIWGGIIALARAWQSGLPVGSIVTWIQIIRPMLITMHNFFAFFQQAAVRHHAHVEPLLRELKVIVNDLTRAPPAQDQISQLSAPARKYALEGMFSSLDALEQTLQRAKRQVSGTGCESTMVKSAARTSTVASAGQLALLERTFEGPGHLRTEGPRHDNDHADIRNISITPTKEELLCTIEPFIPANVPGAPHHLPEGTFEKRIDVQFRLLREETVGPLRKGIAAVVGDLKAIQSGSDDQGGYLAKTLREGGGRYMLSSGSSDLSIYGDGNLGFSNVRADRFRGILVDVSFVSPSKALRGNAIHYWENYTRRGLTSGNLVALVIVEPDQKTTLHIGVVRSRPDAIIASVKSTGHPTVSVNFVDTAAVKDCLRMVWPEGSLVVLVEAVGLLFDVVTPFLSALQSARSELLPFEATIAASAESNDSLKGAQIKPPRYAAAPGFEFDLTTCLTGPSQERLKMTLNEDSIEMARHHLHSENCSLDPSQADAVLSALLQDVSLIQGPPGTGKTYTGVAIVDALVKNDIAPILVVCVTNHALDAFLGHILDQGVTNQIVRLGGRSKDERIQGFALNLLSAARGRKDNPRRHGAAYKELKQADADFKEAIEDITKESLELEDLIRHGISDAFPHHIHALDQPLASLPPLSQAAFDDAYGWEIVGPHGKPSRHGVNAFQLWREGRDLDFLEAINAQMKVQDELPIGSSAAREPPQELEPDDMPAGSRQAVRLASMHSQPVAEVYRPGEEEWAWMEDDTSDVESGGGNDQKDDYNSGQGTSSILQGDWTTVEASQAIKSLRRPVEALMADPNVWSYSRIERQQICEHWAAMVKSGNNERLQTACDGHARAVKGLSEVEDQQKLDIARNVHIIGCTTTGAAKLTALLGQIKPKVLIVEEAGEVLEAHVLAALSPSVEQLILIGDPKQLRPHISNYALSIENARGGQLHRLDLSLMERLADEACLSMSVLTVQRRMRPEISDLVRPLYADLSDHRKVLEYEDVRGVQDNLVFFDHDHPESGGSHGTTSKCNLFEVGLVTSFVKHLIRLGYRDIAILTPYLGQLAKLRIRLGEQRIVTVMEQRDADHLAHAEAEGDVELQPIVAIENRSLLSSVRLATIDNYQGEEAEIVVISLVRSDASDKSTSKTMTHSGIGFLKSPNRSNVALSRAKKGLFIMGKASLLSDHSSFWGEVLSMMADRGQIHAGFPLQCSNHPHQKTLAKTAEDIEIFAPDGGCSLECGALLSCGHVCSSKCHPGDPAHRTTRCTQPCPKLHDGCAHPCTKLCYQDCGPCKFQVEKLQLPCGHTASKVKCSDVRSGLLKCTEIVEKRLASCEHSAKVRCCDDVKLVECRAPCGSIRTCCGASCPAPCYQCQQVSADAHQGAVDEENTGAQPRDRHVKHPCKRKHEACGHACPEQ